MLELVNLSFKVDDDGNKKEILKAGADLYIPKPYEIDDIVFWIKKFLN